MSTPINDEFTNEDSNDTSLPVTLPPDVAVQAAQALLERAGLGQRYLVVESAAVGAVRARLAEHDQVPRAGMTISLSTLRLVEAARRLMVSMAGRPL
jgi:hypothetical protein